MIVAGLDILSGLAAPIGLFIGRYQPFAALPGAPPEMAKIIELQQRMLSGPAPGMTLFVAALGVGAGGFAIYSGTRVLSAKPGARIPFRQAIWFVAMATVAGAASGLWLQMRNIELVEETMQAMSAHHGAASPVFDATMKGFMHGGALVGVAMAVGLELVKLAVLAWGHHVAGTKEASDYLDER
jgi:hypothetical protein